MAVDGAFWMGIASPKAGKAARFGTGRTGGLFDAIIIGGGIAGCSTAYFLAADGAQAAVLEQFEPGSLASSANAGSLHVQIQPEPFHAFGEAWARAFAPALPFYAESLSLWRQTETALGEDFQIVQNGGLLIAESDADMRFIEAKMRIERAAGLEMALLSAADLRDRAPWIADSAVGGAFCPVEGQANPLIAAQSFAAAAAALGARIESGCQVRAIRRSKAGYEAETSKGRFRAARLVNAAGADAPRIAKLLGSALPLESFPLQLIVTEPAEPLLDQLIYSAADPLTLKQTKIGSVLIGGGWPGWLDGRGHAQVAARSLLGNLRAAGRLVPALQPLRMIRAWAAQAAGNRSWLPMLGELPGVPGCFVNCVPWMGFSGAPAASRIVASLVQGRTPPMDFDVSCFAP